MKILELSATELAKKIKAGEITSEEAAKASLAQIAKEDQKIRAYLTVDEEKVLARAKEVDNGIRSGTVCFLIIRGEVFHTGSDAFRLYAPDICRRHLSCQIWIFGHIFKIPSAERTAFDINCRAEEHAHVLSLTLVPKDLSHTFHQFHVKAGCRGAGCRKADCIHTFIQAEMICRSFLFAQTVRAVCHHNGRNP